MLELGTVGVPEPELGSELELGFESELGLGSGAYPVSEVVPLPFDELGSLGVVDEPSS